MNVSGIGGSSKPGLARVQRVVEPDGEHLARPRHRRPERRGIIGRAAAHVARPGGELVPARVHGLGVGGEASARRPLDIDGAVGVEHDEPVIEAGHLHLLAEVYADP